MVHVHKVIKKFDIWSQHQQRYVYYLLTDEELLENRFKYLSFGLNKLHVVWTS